jgi:hypothetical protein
VREDRPERFVRRAPIISGEDCLTAAVTLDLRHEDRSACIAEHQPIAGTDGIRTPAIRREWQGYEGVVQPLRGGGILDGSIEGFDGVQPGEADDPEY